MRDGRAQDEPDVPAGRPGPPDPEELEAAGSPANAEISALTSLGPVHLTVSALDRSLVYYRTMVGLEILERSAERASLGVSGHELLVLTEEAGARPAVGHTGLYHFALLLPQRVELARWLAHAARDRVPLVGLSDHFVSEAIYLSDPDEHGIEIYWDRPREMWGGQVASRMTTLPLDVEDLLSELEGRPPGSFAGLPAGTVMGHVHLKVAHIPETIAFYRDVIGLALMARLGQQAAFFAAGGYHHHFGANTWDSAGASPPPKGTAALHHATILLRNDEERERILHRLDAGSVQPTEEGPMIRDPAGNALLLGLSVRRR